MSMIDDINLPRGSLAMLLSLIVFCYVAELIGESIVQQTVHTWYPLLKKPDWTIPSILFAPVWTILYLFLAFATWLVWLTPSEQPKTSAYILFSTQLILNITWSTLFFYFKMPMLGLINDVILFTVVVFTMLIYYRVRPLSGILMVPNIIWLAYTIALNSAIVLLNQTIPASQ